MSAALLEYAIGNTILAMPLAVLAWAIGRNRRNPSVAHLAWVLVLVRLAMPPVALAPWLSIEVPGISAVVAGPEVRATKAAMAPEASAGGPAHSPSASQRAGHRISEHADDGSVSPSRTLGIAPPSVDMWAVLGALWLAGTGVIAVVSIVRIARFRRALHAAAVPAGAAVLQIAERAAASLGMRMRAQIMIASTGAVPFIWWCMGRACIVLPASTVNGLDERELFLVLKHELAHMRRRDHMVRWLDWAVVSWLWWNPLAWIARRGIRANEELACDALVLRTRDTAPSDYGRCLIAVAESISSPVFRAPAQACTMGDGGSLEERIRLIMSDTLRNRPSVSLRSLAVAAAGASMLIAVAHGGTARAGAAGPTQGEAPAAPPPPVAPPAPPAAAPAGGAGNTSDESRTLQATVEGASSLNVYSMNGSITVVRDESAKAMQVTAVVGGAGWSSSVASSDTRKKILDGTTLVAERDSSGRVNVRVNVPPFTNNSPGVKITIRVASLSQVDAETMNGSISVTGDLGKVAAETMNGSVDISGAKGDVKAESMNGRINVSLADGATASVAAETTNGSMALELPASWNGKVEASVVNGKVTADGLSGSWDRSVTGAEFEATVGSAGTAKATLSAVNGSVTIKRPS
jgi:beta-lactamase regulating signal transducer with metallopeptidase domain